MFAKNVIRCAGISLCIGLLASGIASAEPGYSPDGVTCTGAGCHEEGFGPAAQATDKSTEETVLPNAASEPATASAETVGAKTTTPSQAAASTDGVPAEGGTLAGHPEPDEVLDALEGTYVPLSKVSDEERPMGLPSGIASLKISGSIVSYFNGSGDVLDTGKYTFACYVPAYDLYVFKSANSARAPYLCVTSETLKASGLVRIALLDDVNDLFRGTAEDMLEGYVGPEATEDDIAAALTALGR